MLKDGDKPISKTEAARQTSNAFQMVIANFYSYKTGNAVNKFLAFSHFGPVSDEYCEPRYGGRRSYFENDPSLRQWRMQMARMSSQLPW
ncbi:hypothetical protein BGW36DRAFT_385576 [Talaromyces proteolyticus]|uniref:Uncharacterized protein n=1 Tax=Talaromyces proteolyticus TaxID=1131652 RepID=A0AAD4KI31_9EURO|nr:uncharacterized protein BGW36DRAFT_385576 [Talaromyces proteolyticus]KAH8692947.1 hypothetical protein BGW36DRAFT_385576 [Talaromyces proteolyticus]